MNGIIDRFEGSWVVIEIDGVTKDIEKSIVDPAAKEGDVVTLISGIWKVDAEAMAERSKHIKNLMDSVWDD